MESATTTLDVISGAGPRAWTIEVCDCRDGLRRLPDNSVHCVVTSPPYWGLRDYQLTPSVWGGDPDCDHQWDDAGQFCQRCDAWLGCLGLEPDPYSYVDHIVDVFCEVRRVLRKDGTLWINMGDAYANDGKWGGETGGKQSYLGDADRRRNGRAKRRTGLKPKDLIGLPWMVAFALRGAGWWLRDDIIWNKTNSLPESVEDRPSRSHEYLFLLSKSKRYYYDRLAVAEPLTSDPASWGRHSKKDPGAHALRPRPMFANGRDGTEWGDGCFRNKRSVWTIATQPYPGAHFATFPTDLVAPCILAGTSDGGCCPNCLTPRRRVTEVTYKNPGRRSTNGQRSKDRTHVEFGTAGFEQRLERAARTLGWQPGCKCEDSLEDDAAAIVLDPFSGVGTTGLVARTLGRRYIGFEASAEYAAQAEARIRNRGARTNTIQPLAGQAFLF